MCNLSSISGQGLAWLLRPIVGHQHRYHVVPVLEQS